LTRPSSTAEPAAAGSRLARVQALVGAMKTYIAAEVIRQDLSSGEHGMLTDLFARCSHATTALGPTPDAAREVIDVEVELLRQLAMDVRSFAMRHHLMLISPIWTAPPVAQEANRVFFSGGAAVEAIVSECCRERGLELEQRPATRRFAESRWQQLQAANVAVFDLSVPAGPELAAVCYELGVALATGRGIVIVADSGAVIPFDVHIEPVSVDADDPFRTLEAAIDAAMYERQFGGGDSALPRTMQHLRSTLGSSGNGRVRQMLDLFGPDAEKDPVLFRSRVGSLIGLIGSDAPRVATPAWPGTYPGTERRCFHVMPFGPPWADAVRDGVERACTGRARYIRGDEAKDFRIIRSIWDEICRATHVVVDITDFNPNVALELGMAHTLGRRTLIVAQGGPTIERLFPSIAKLRVHQYSIDELQGTVERAVEEFLLE
jgi:hypothetical protein